MFKEFTKFAMRGNVLDLAVGRSCFWENCIVVC